MERYRAHRVLGAERRGSSWPVVVTTDAGRFHVKLHGAAQGPTALVAEIIVGALADALGLPVPARVLVELPEDVPRDDGRDELADLLRASTGWNLGFQTLPGPREFRSDDAASVEPALGARILWLDRLVQNPDRTDANPNLLWSHGRLWLIDHGACLPFQHDWSVVTEATPRLPWSDRGGHLFRGAVDLLPAVDPGLAARLDRATVVAAVEQVPAAFLPAGDAESIRRRRAAFVAFLWKRLAAPRPFLIG